MIVACVAARPSSWGQREKPEVLLRPSPAEWAPAAEMTAELELAEMTKAETVTVADRQPMATTMQTSQPTIRLAVC